MKVSLDWYAWYDIANRKGRFQFIPEILMFHRIHEQSETTNMIEDQHELGKIWKCMNYFGQNQLQN